MIYNKIILFKEEYIMSNNYEELKQKQIELIGFNPYNEKECLEAVKQDSHVLRYIKEQTKDICMESVKQNGLALKYVKDLNMLL